MKNRNELVAELYHKEETAGIENNDSSTQSVLTQEQRTIRANKIAEKSIAELTDLCKIHIENVGSASDTKISVSHCDLIILEETKKLLNGLHYSTSKIYEIEEGGGDNGLHYNGWFCFNLSL